MHDEGILVQDKETAAEARAHTEATAQRHYVSHGQAERLGRFHESFRISYLVSNWSTGTGTEWFHQTPSTAGPVYLRDLLLTPVVMLHH